MLLFEMNDASDWLVVLICHCVIGSSGTSIMS